jgi:hypothetical protein
MMSKMFGQLIIGLLQEGKDLLQDHGIFDAFKGFINEKVKDFYGIFVFIDLLDFSTRFGNEIMGC